ncbi:hypothetical protein M0813_20068 [Anaeramoeba flamelloides]|uniref:Uncharacterized protein n=1 Tax=Anaeramoeba flamelloides TaxID=1746091 RepID=A0ABQ8YM24_9EUKA|nr:hypothetical protein M0813_20068 [Anaeramoeba flamelloides]
MEKGRIQIIARCRRPGNESRLDLKPENKTKKINNLLQIKKSDQIIFSQHPKITKTISTPSEYLLYTPISQQFKFEENYKIKSRNKKTSSYAKA